LDQVNARFSALTWPAFVLRLVSRYPANPQQGDHQNGDIGPVTQYQPPSRATRDTGLLNWIGQWRHSGYLCELVSLQRGWVGWLEACRHAARQGWGRCAGTL